MTESEWLGCTEPKWMLRHLIGTDALRVTDVPSFPDCKTSERKLRLFACACYGRLYHSLPDPVARDAVETAERFADGAVTVREMKLVLDRLDDAIGAIEGRWRQADGAEYYAMLPEHEGLALASQACRPEAPKAAWYASSNAYLTAAAMAGPNPASTDGRDYATQRVEERAQTDLLRCIVGPVTFRQIYLEDAWRTPTTVALALAAYIERPFPGGELNPDRLAVLADALEEAGCEDADVLTHLRSTGPHVRGCWALDLVLNLE